MKANVGRFLRIAVSVSLIVYLLSLMDLEGVGQRLTGVRPQWLACAFALLFWQTAISSFKWKLILSSDGVALRFLYLFRTYLVGGFVSLFLPTSFGGDVYKVYSVTRAQGGLGKIASSVLFDRLTGLFALVSIGLIGYTSLPDPQYLGLIVAAYVTIVIGFFLSTSDWALELLGRIPESRLWKMAMAPIRSFAVYRRNYRMLLTAILISLLFQFGHIISTKFYCMALGIDISIGLLTVIVPIIYLTEVLPISINGIGVRDSAFVFFFGMLGYQLEDGLSVALVALFMQYLYNLIGGGIFLFDSIKGREVRPVQG